MKEATDAEQSPELTTATGSDATCGLKMLCRWVNTQTYAVGKADGLYHGTLGTVESELIFSSTCAA